MYEQNGFVFINVNKYLYVIPNYSSNFNYYDNVCIYHKLLIIMNHITNIRFPILTLKHFWSK